MRSGFTVIEPSPDARELPLIVEIPHAGVWVDGPALATIAAPARSIGLDSDLWVDELYAGASEEGATTLVADVSRYVVDLNRSERDVDAESIEGAPPNARATRGIVWRLTSEGTHVLEGPISRRELDRRLDTYYRPYHRKLQALIDAKRARFGYAVVLAGHSMPSVGRAGVGGSADGNGQRADVVPGTRGLTSAARPFIDAVDALARRTGLSVAHDDPYQGGYTTLTYGKPADRVHVVQVELARRLYMDEKTLRKTAGFERIQAFCTELVRAVGSTSVQ